MRTAGCTTREDSDTFDSVPAGGMFCIEPGGDIVYLKTEDGFASNTTVGKITQFRQDDTIWRVETVALEDS